MVPSAETSSEYASTCACERLPMASDGIARCVGIASVGQKGAFAFVDQFSVGAPPQDSQIGPSDLTERHEECRTEKKSWSNLRL